MTPWWVPIVTLVIGALIAAGSNYLNEVRKEKRARDHRWDVPLYELSSEYIGSIRTLMHLCGRYRRSSDQEAAKIAIDQIHSESRALSHRIRLIASAEAYKSARLIQHHAYAVRATLVEGKPDMRSPAPFESPEYVNPRKRVEIALQQFLVAVRTDLQIAEATDVPVDPLLDDNPWVEDRATQPKATAAGE